MNNKLVLAILLVTVGFLCLGTSPVNGQWPGGQDCTCRRRCGWNEISSGPCRGGGGGWWYGSGGGRVRCCRRRYGIYGK